MATVARQNGIRLRPIERQESRDPAIRNAEPIEIVDQLKDSLMANARRQHEEPLAFIANRQVFGDLVDDERFTTAYTSALNALHSKGARATLEDLMGSDRSRPESGAVVDA